MDMSEVPLRPVDLLFPERRQRMADSVCTTCGDKIIAHPHAKFYRKTSPPGYCFEDLFHDDLSVREYRISGMCQKCQDSVFGVKL